FLRWQSTNAFLLGISRDNIASSTNLESSSAYYEWFGRSTNEYWNKVRRGFFVWTNRDLTGEESNTVALHYDHFVTVHLPNILNMGCQLAGVGQIHWEGDSFVLTNQAKGIRLHGHIVRDKNGRAEKMVVEQNPLDKVRGSEKEDYLPWEYEYFYERQL